MQKKFKYIIIYLSVVFICLLLPVSYSLFSYGGTLSGVAVVPAVNEGIKIIRVNYLSNNNANPDLSSINRYYDTTIESRIVLGNNRNSTISYTVTLKNYDLSSTKYSGIEFVGDNNNIEVVVSGINVGDTISALESKDITITFKFKNNVYNTNNNIVNSTLKFLFDNSDYSYEQEEDLILDGTNYLNTGIPLFSRENANKDFEASFVLESFPNGQTNMAVIFGNLNETGNPYPGILVRYQNGISLVANVNVNDRKENPINLQVGNKMVIKRVNGILSYSVDGGNTFTNYADFSSFNNYFDAPATFGAGLDGNLQPFRYYRGTLSHMSLKLIEPEYYTIKFDANGGNGTMNDQVLNVNISDSLTPNTFTINNRVFSHWNTKADGTGKDYSDREVVKGLTSVNEEITLYAQWAPYPHYFVKFDNNGGNGLMSNQEFVYGTMQNLNTSTYTKNNYTFMNWNTKPDGSGITYRDEELVGNLSTVEGDIVTLYAMYGIQKYEYNNQIVFNGSNYLNSNLSLFNQDHIHRNFELSFEIVNVGNNVNLNALVNAMYEVQPWPGFVFRTSNNNTFEFNGNFGNVALAQNYNNNITKVIIRNINDTLYFSSDGVNFQNVANISGMTTINTPVTFGASLNGNNAPFRYFNGTLRNIYIYLY